jgi:hypothetical protein
MTNLKKTAADDARKYGIDSGAFTRQINTESRFQKHAVSTAGARGVAQIMPSTARGWHVNPDDPIAALDAAAKHMAQYVKQAGSYKGALEMYNLGHTAPDNALPAETRNYIRTILGQHPSAGTSTASPAAVSRVVPGHPTQDTTSAIMDALATGEGGGGLVHKVLYGLASGKYDSVTPSHTTTSYGLPVRQGNPASSHAPATHHAGVANFEGHQVAAWIKPELEYARAHGWTGTISSGFRTLADQTRIYNSGVRPAARPGTSNHEGSQFPRGAVDTTQSAQLSHILSSKGSPLVWAGSKDPVHFSHPHGGSY